MPPFLLLLLFLKECGSSSPAAAGMGGEEASRTAKEPGCRLEAEVVHEEGGPPVRRFRLYLSGEGLQAVTTDGSDYPYLKKGWNCSPLHVTDWGEESVERDEFSPVRVRVKVGEGVDVDVGEIRVRGPDAGLNEYRTRRRVVGGEGRFRWRIEADGCDPVQRFLSLREAGIADLEEVRLRAASAIVEGTVFGLDGLPVPGAKVELSGLERSKAKRRGPRDGVVTDARGAFRFDEVPAGEGFVFAHPGPARPMPPVPVATRAGETTRADLRPEVGSVLLRLADPGEWKRPFELCLQGSEGATYFRWTLMPPRPEPGERIGTFPRGVFGTACSYLEETIRLSPAGRGGTPPWQEGPPLVRGEGERSDVLLGEDGRSAAIRNVPAGEWRVAIWPARRSAPEDVEGRGEPGIEWLETWEAPPLEPRPETFTLRAGVSAQVLLAPR